MTSPAQRAQIDLNYEALERFLPAILLQRRDQEALMRDGEIVSYHADAGGAYREGIARYPDRIFSIQRVTDEPIYLGVYPLSPV